MVVKNPILALACSAALVACGGDDGGSKGAAGGPVPWTEVADEAPGDNCAGGGVRISVGVDDDGDGALDGSEVTTTRYVCNGVSGDGLTLEDIKPLLVVSEEPPGDNCANGGRRLRVGVDRDGDGKLDAAEVESTEYDCHPEALARVHFGSFEVRTPADVEALAEYDIVLGDLWIAASFPGSSLSLAGLRTVGGYVQIDNCDGAAPAELESLDFPDLERAGDLTIHMACGSSALTSLTAPQLRDVGGWLTIEETAIEVIDLPSLELVVGELGIVENPSLQSVSLPKLRRAYGALVRDNAQLSGFAVPELTSLETAYFSENVALSDCVQYRMSGLALARGSDYYYLYNNGEPCDDPAALCPEAVGFGVDSSLRVCFFAEETNFADGRSLCGELGDDYDLAEFTSAADFAALVNSEFLDRFSGAYWIGYSDEAEEGDWQWVAGSAFEPGEDGSFWNAGSPDDDTARNCASLGGNGRVSDVPCGSMRTALCRRL